MWVRLLHKDLGKLLNDSFDKTVLINLLLDLNTIFSETGGYTVTQHFPIEPSFVCVSENFVFLGTCRFKILFEGIL